MPATLRLTDTPPPAAAGTADAAASAGSPPRQAVPGRRGALPLAGKVDHDADAAQVAEAMVSIWLEIEASLAPVIGHRGMAALYERSLYLTATSHPWLPVPHEAPQSIDLSALQSVVAQQASTEALRGGSTLLHTFCELLGSLIGDPLARRLLGPLWEPGNEDAQREVQHR
ncbi:hypothetical protein LRH25_12835 [Ideonella azotifigens]|nr:hypothetical protein [Ideonella azotifigens]MCD2341227.1 hypothetical protein [Ideonella azotifigens]